MKLKGYVTGEDIKYLAQFRCHYPQRHDINLCEEAFADALDQTSPHCIVDGARWYNLYAFVKYKNQYPDSDYIMKAVKWLENKQWETRWKAKAMGILGVSQSDIYDVDPNTVLEAQALSKAAQDKVERDIAEMDARAEDVDDETLMGIMRRCGL